MATTVDRRKLQDLLERKPELSRLFLPRLNKYIPHVPTPKQAAFLLPTHKLEGLYGGAAAGGKTDALLMAALQYVDCSNYSALILRRTYNQLNQPDSILSRAHQWLRKTDAKWIAQHNRYEFPSGAMLTFGYLQYFKDVYNYDSATFQFIGCDELTQMLPEMYTFMFGRLRRLSHQTHIPLRMRGATNPGGVGHLWVKNRFILKHSVKSRFFIPARLEDNPHADQASYRLALSMLDPVSRLQREMGDWDAAAAGTIFQREWFQEFVDKAPAKMHRVRFWDLAATPKKSSNEPDYAVGTLAGHSKKFYIEDVIRVRRKPGMVDELVINTAKMDGREVKVRIEQEPGASGKILIANFAQRLPGFDVAGIPSSGPKASRWGPLAAEAKKGNIVLVNGAWHHDWLDEMIAVPNSIHDDQADAAAGAVLTLITEPEPFFGISTL